MCNYCFRCCGDVKLDEHPKLMGLICTAIGVAGIGLILTIAFNDQDTMLGLGIALGVAGIAGTILGCIHMQSASAVGDMKKDDDFLGSENVGAASLAPGKVPSPFDVSKGKVRGVDDDASPAPTRIAPATSPEQRATNEELGIGTDVRWAGVNSSPARGILPDMSQHQQGGTTRNYIGTNSSIMFQEIAPALGGPREQSPQPRSVGGAAAVGPPMLSPFEKRSFPVPASLFPAPTPGINNNKPALNGRPLAFTVDTGVSNSNGYDSRTTQNIIRQNQGDMDAIHAAQHGERGPINMGDDDEDKLPSDWHHERR